MVPNMAVVVASIEQTTIDKMVSFLDFSSKFLKFYTHHPHKNTILTLKSAIMSKIVYRK